MIIKLTKNKRDQCDVVKLEGVKPPKIDNCTVIPCVDTKELFKNIYSKNKNKKGE